VKAADDNMAHAHCMLDTWGYKYTYRLCNTGCFSTTTVVERTPLSVTLHVHCLPCFITNKTLPVTDAKHRATSFCAIQYVNLHANKNLVTNISFKLVCVDH
jgi:hypothetical protein